MSDPRSDSGDPSPLRDLDTLEAQSAYIEQVLEELFHLLEDHAPVWYTEQHHNRAVVALRLLKDT